MKFRFNNDVLNSYFTALYVEKDLIVKEELTLDWQIIPSYGKSLQQPNTVFSTLKKQPNYSMNKLCNNMQIACRQFILMTQLQDNTTPIKMVDKWLLWAALSFTLQTVLLGDNTYNEPLPFSIDKKMFSQKVGLILPLSIHMKDISNH